MSFGIPSVSAMQAPSAAAAASPYSYADIADLAAAARQRFPRLTLSGALGLLSFDLGRLFDDQSQVYSASAGVLAPLLDFGRIQAQIDGAAAGKRLNSWTMRLAAPIPPGPCQIKHDFDLFSGYCSIAKGRQCRYAPLQDLTEPTVPT